MFLFVGLIECGMVDGMGGEVNNGDKGLYMKERNLLRLSHQRRPLPDPCQVTHYATKLSKVHNIPHKAVDAYFKTYFKTLLDVEIIRCGDVRIQEWEASQSIADHFLINLTSAINYC